MMGENRRPHEVLSLATVARGWNGQSQKPRIHGSFKKTRSGYGILTIIENHLGTLYRDKEGVRNE